MVALEEPKRPQNPYWLWLAENREALAKEVGGGKVYKHAAGVARKRSARFFHCRNSFRNRVRNNSCSPFFEKAMSAAQKQPYEAKSAEKQAAYAKAMEEFKAQGGQPGKRRQKKEEREARSKRARKVARRASGQPPRPRNAYWLFLAENREAFAKQAGGGKATKVGKIAGESWKALPAAQKQPFEAKAAELKAAYEKALEEWKKNGGGVGDDDGEDGEEEEEENEEEE